MRRKTFGLIVMTLGVMMVLQKMGVYDFTNLFDQEWKKYIIPVCVILLGIKLVFTSGNHHHDGMKATDIPDTPTDKPIRLEASLSGNEYNMKGQEMRDLDVQVFMGGMKIDMREAVFTHDCQINVHTFMGGAELFVPTNIRVEVSSHCLIGGVGNATRQQPSADAPTLYINASCLLGGADLKN